MPIDAEHRLTLGKHGLDLIDQHGHALAHLKVRAKQMDLRRSAEGALAIVFDADAQRALPIRINLSQPALLPQPLLPATAYAVDSLCLYHDAQGLDSLFLIGKSGRTEQWLLSGETARPLRELSLPPGTEHCRVDDASHTLYASESNFGVWAYPAAVEAAAGRQLVGRLTGGSGALAVLPGGLAVLADNGRALLTFRQQQGKWSLVKRQALAARVDAEQLAIDTTNQPPTATLRQAADGRWQQLPLAWSETAKTADQLPIIMARVQTDSVAQFGDAADDPAIWIHPSDPEASMILATNKKQGLLRYDLQGHQRQFLKVGRVNNVDLRQNLLIDGQPFDLAVATQRDENSLVIFAIDTKGEVSEAGRIATDLPEIYGICLYRPASGGLEIIANDKSGAFRQYGLAHHDARFTGQLLRSFKLPSQPEGCVADDRSARLFIGEEDRGIWVMSADAKISTERQMVLPVGPRLSADVEGLTIYRGSDGAYLLASSQGNSSYVVLDAEPPYAYRGAFRIGINVDQAIDGTSETDGIDVTSSPLGQSFEHGMLVVQDGNKRLPEGRQNFKYVAWEDIAHALKLR